MEFLTSARDFIEMRKIDRDQMNRFALSMDINLSFSLPSADLMGGAWKIHILSVKSALHVTLKNQAPNEEILLTILM